MLTVKTYQSLEVFPGGKFVILAHGKDLHLILSPLDLTPYHANIVHRYLEGEGLGRVEAASSSGIRILTPGWKVKGGGHFQVETLTHTLTLQGKSTAFGKYHARLLEPYELEIPERLGLAGYALEML